MSHSVGYREVIPNQILPETWKEISFTIGSNQSTLQDIKVPEKAGGYSYKDSSSFITRNRFIYWRIFHDQLELIEKSLDINLVNSCVRYRFTDTPLLDGISIHETNDQVIILIISVSSVHKLSFTHPSKYKEEEYSDSSPYIQMQSIFNEASSQTTNETHMIYILPNIGVINSSVPHTSASSLDAQKNLVFFALAYSSGLILLIRLDLLTGFFQTIELKQESLVPRFLTGLATAFRRQTIENQTAMSLTFFKSHEDMYLFALCREGDLHLWSCNKVQCIFMIDVVTDRKMSSQDAETYILKKAINSDDELFLGSCLRFENRCEFSFFKMISQNTGAINIKRICSVLSTDLHLVDFSFTTDNLWAVWRMPDLDTTTVKHTNLPLENTEVKIEWNTVVMEHLVDRDHILNDFRTDPHQSYMRSIFCPGQFSVTDIIRALNIYKKTNRSAETSVSVNNLKERIYAAVEAEIHNEIVDYELTDEDYLEIVNRCWYKFYSCIVQYHLSSCRPVGLLLLPNSCGAVLLKKASYSILRPLEISESLTFENKKSFASLLEKNSLPIQNVDDLQTLMIILNLIDQNLSEDLKNTIEKELFSLKNPNILLNSIISALLPNFDFEAKIYGLLETIKDLPSTIAILLGILTLNSDNAIQSKDESRFQNYRYKNNLKHVFNSQIGISTISMSIIQIISRRFSICRNLLILQQIIFIKSEFLHSHSFNLIKSSLNPRTVILVQAYYAIKWICEFNDYSYQPEKQNINSELLSILKFDEKKTIPVSGEHFSLLDCFIQNCASEYYFKFSSQEISYFDYCNWHYGMIKCITNNMELLWPMSNNFIFPQWLLSNNCYLPILEYVRLLNHWCEWNSASRKFILAVTYLEYGEYNKACDLFLKASNGISSEYFLLEILLKQNSLIKSNCLIRYYLKVIELFDQHNVSDCIIELAETALTVADENDINLATIYSIIFNHHLNLEHYVEAYHYLNTNPEPSRRVDCLRQLINIFFEKNKLIELLSLPYVELYEDLERIMESRARSIDVAANNYYNFLYSFHINNNNFRKAARVMYEQALRLSEEDPTLLTITRQSQCLLACINSLHLVSQKYRWIVRPVIHDFSEDKTNFQEKNNALTDVSQYEIKKNIEVITLEDIKNENLMLEAKIKIFKYLAGTHVSSIDSKELVVALSNAKLHTTALKLCDSFKLPKNVVFENFTLHCLQENLNDDSSAWLWLIKNDMYDLIRFTVPSRNAACRILEELVNNHEAQNESELHICIAKKILFSGSFFPEWLSSSLKKRNITEFLRLMMKFGRLREASELAIEYYSKALQGSKDLFNFKIDSSTPISLIPLPINAVEILLLELDNIRNLDPRYNEIFKLLKNTVDKYLKTTTRASENLLLTLGKVR